MRYLIETTTGVHETDDNYEAVVLMTFLGDRFVSACGKGRSRRNPTFQMLFKYPESVRQRNEQK